MRAGRVFLATDVISMIDGVFLSTASTRQNQAHRYHGLRLTIFISIVMIMIITVSNVCCFCGESCALTAPQLGTSTSQHEIMELAQSPSIQYQLGLRRFHFRCNSSEDIKKPEFHASLGGRYAALSSRQEVDSTLVRKSISTSPAALIRTSSSDGCSKPTTSVISSAPHMKLSWFSSKRSGYQHQ